jgi:hypothetical protein
MAEQFILPNARSYQVEAFLKSVAGCTISDLMHTHIGWTNNSRNAYNGMMGLRNQQAIVNRNGLPPHFYIEIPANKVINRVSETIPVIDNLSRGIDTLDILKSLDNDGGAGNAANSRNQWAQGQKLNALNSELAKGNVSIGIYYMDGTEVTQKIRDRVAAF